MQRVVKFYYMIVPSCTYRIQFNPRFRFAELRALKDYLAQLGITALYSSPILRPTLGSEHGYDGIDVTMINPELGTEEEMETLSKELMERGICWIQDIVPNHLAFHTANVWLYDVLERGMNSSYADHFDIDWSHPAYPQKLMVPFLEASLTECIEQKKLQLEWLPEKGFCFGYYDNHYPVHPDGYAKLFSGALDEDAHQELYAALSALVGNIKAPVTHWNQLKQQLVGLVNSSIAAIPQEIVQRYNEDKSLLLELINTQAYVLCHHMESQKQINYRRFFNVNGLICLKIERQEVFDDYHRYFHHLYQKGIIHGMRVDHIDGLRDPHEYIRRLRTLFGKDAYIIVEKILDVKEELPASMDIQGTSGYEFLSYINQVLTDSKGAEQLLELYSRYMPWQADYDTIVFRNKLANFETYLNGEWDNLLRYLLSLNLIDDAEIRLPDLKRALGVFMASFPVYRVYIEKLPVEINDEQLIVQAFVAAMKRHPEYQYQLGILRQLFEPHTDPTRNTNRLLFIQRLMQFTGPLAAKGVEDTTFYQYNPLISHNEVGDQPCVLGIPVRHFHEKMQQRLQKNAFSLNCTSTHDTKRGEDNRVRINVISELTSEWEQLVARWLEVNAPFRKKAGDSVAPVINDEYFLYQAIAGAFPEDLEVTPQFIERTKKYFVKVLRESKTMSDHVAPNIRYENTCLQFIEALLTPGSEYLESLKPFAKKLIRYANIYSMEQVIIKMTAPGIPDVYQGCELWDLSYVDPDNRRAVNYELRKELLNTIFEKEKTGRKETLQWAADHYHIGTQKMFVTQQMLALRNAHRELFLTGDYIPVYTAGSDRIVIAYFRKKEDTWILIVLPMGVVTDSRKELQLIIPEEAPKNWKHLFTEEEFSGGTIAVSELLRTFPVAVLVQNNTHGN